MVENMKRAVSNAQKAVEEASAQVSQAIAEGGLAPDKLDVSDSLLRSSDHLRQGTCWQVIQRSHVV